MRKKWTSAAAVIMAMVLLLASLPVYAAAGGTIYEAENADYRGQRVADANCSGGAYVKITLPITYCRFEIDIERAGFYDLVITSAGQQSDKLDNILIDGEFVEYLRSPSDVFAEQTLERVFLSAGRHTVSITPMYGWTWIDCLEVVCVEEVDYDSIYDASSTLSNPDASASAGELMQFLASNYGKSILAGQQCETGYYGEDIQRIQAHTGKAPAILGMDLMSYTPSRAEKGEVGESIDNALEFSAMGGITTLCWHWNAPDKYLISPELWGNGFRTPNLNIDFSEIMDGNDPEGYEVLMADIDAIAAQLKRLAEADVPVLFRPLHEASGGWFWWGSDGPEPYIALWKILYEKLTVEHGLNNLIWVWNGQSKDWYPGDAYVDIVGEDIYAEKRYYDVHAEKFAEVTGYADTKKVTALSENGVLIDIDQAVATNTMWSWFCTWQWVHSVIEGDDVYTEPEVWTAVYNHEKVMTLDELPWHTHTDRNGDQVCDTCTLAPSDETPDKMCGCVCHSSSKLTKSFYKTMWRLLGTNPVCACGSVHS